MKKFLILLLASSLAYACNNRKMKDDKSTIYHVNSFKVPCEGFGPMSCLQIRKGDPPVGDWQLFYSTIEGFKFEPGYLYKLSVEEEMLPPGQVPADASSVRYKLKEVLQKQRDPKLRLNDIWVLEAIDRTPIGTGKNAGRGERPYLEIQLAREAYLGNDGCNEFRGPLQEVGAKKLSFGPVAGTDMICENMTVPDQFIRALPKVQSYKIEALELILLDPEGKEVLRFRKTD